MECCQYKKKDKKLPRDNCRILYLSEIDEMKPTIECATVHYKNGVPYIEKEYKIPIKTGLKWCYNDEFDFYVIEK